MPADDGARPRPTRRDVIAAAAASSLALTAGAGFAAPPAVAAGHVFHDRRGTGRRSAGDPGIAGVLVCNGRDVVLTDEEGRWRLPVWEGDSVFVIKPAHWATPCGPGGVPVFSYLHQPQGSPRDTAYAHPGVAPTGPLPATIDFPLRRQEEGRSFEAVLTADTQPQNADELAYLRDDIIAAVLDCGAAFAINHGDIVFDDLALYPRYLQILGASGIPWHHCAGNHDINPEARHDGASRETWKRVFGPRHYAFEYGEATFIMLDNVHYLGASSYCGLIGERQLAFVRNVLAHTPPERLVVLSMHIPLVNYQDPADPADNTLDRRALLQLVSSRPQCVSFSGHMHATEHHYLGAEHGFTGPRLHHHHVLTAASGSWWGGPRNGRGLPSADSQDGSPNGFHVLSVDGSRCTTRFVPAASKPQAQLRAVVDGPTRRGPIPAAHLAASALAANVFDGGPLTRVSFEIAAAGAGPTPMQRVAVPDPYMVDLFAAQGAERRGWVRALPSSHVWKAPLPAGLPAGAHAVTVTACDEYGRQHRTRLVLEVAAPHSGA
jgi:hypothetical protein